MSNDFSVIRYPELIFGVAGPVGVDMEAIVTALSESLHSVEYKAVNIRLTDEIAEVPSNAKKPIRRDYYSTLNYKMDHTSEICRDNDDPAWAIRYAIDAIRRERGDLQSHILFDDDVNVEAPFADIAKEDKVLHKVAFIIRQIKRPEEVKLLRSVYGKQFIFVSAYGPVEERTKVVFDKIKQTLPITTKSSKVTSFAEALINKDASEDADDYGQHLRDAFHLADVFIDGMAAAPMRLKIDRFINALFGLNELAPTKAEFGMYAAKGASLRSTDLSRQVGAAIFTSDGEMLVQGCNEVPRAFGGTYWDTEEPDNRDVKLGSDPNDVLKKDVLRDVLERLEQAKMLSDKARKLGKSSGKLIDALTKKPAADAVDDGSGCLHGALISDLTEFGRVVHAEMNCICDAARKGVSLKGAILYCTTFPCHNCTKHILASGIAKVFYMEPYPKSRAKELHHNEIEIEKSSATKVSFMPFLGISPYRYRDIFEKSKRKSGGVAQRWYYESPSPMIDVLVPNYTRLELFAVSKLFGSVTADQPE
ncbi:anti-phage dCTP deaminase [Sphingomonas rubra]|uniref:anti-phage dCTP deaminase n=1 Tax=Sphingomonas rubra TaxID=634430 RepID=UPI0015A72853|nr:anti-phage dCTP deaminase [Sphingomonas rubra]